MTQMADSAGEKLSQMTILEVEGAERPCFSSDQHQKVDETCATGSGDHITSQFPCPHTDLPWEPLPWEPLPPCEATTTPHVLYTLQPGFYLTQLKDAVYGSMPDDYHQTGGIYSHEEQHAASGVVYIEPVLHMKNKERENKRSLSSEAETPVIESPSPAVTQHKVNKNDPTSDSLFRWEEESHTEPEFKKVPKYRALLRSIKNRVQVLKKRVKKHPASRRVRQAVQGFIDTCRCSAYL